MTLNRFHRSPLGVFTRSPLGARGFRTGIWTLFGTCGTNPPSASPPAIYVPGQYPPGTLIISDHGGSDWCMIAISQTATRSSSYNTVPVEDVTFSTYQPAGAIQAADVTVTITGVTASSCCWNVCTFTCPNVKVTDVSDANKAHSVTGASSPLSCRGGFQGSFDVDTIAYNEGQGCTGTPYYSLTNEIDFTLEIGNRYFDCRPRGTSMIIQGGLCNGPGLFQCYPVRGTVPTIDVFDTAYPIEWQTLGLGNEGNCPDATPLIGGTVTVSWNP